MHSLYTSLNDTALNFNKKKKRIFFRISRDGGGVHVIGTFPGYLRSTASDCGFTSPKSAPWSHVQLRALRDIPLFGGICQQHAEEAEDRGCLLALHFANGGAAVSVLPACGHLPLQQLPVRVYIVCRRFYSWR